MQHVRGWELWVDGALLSVWEGDAAIHRAWGLWHVTTYSDLLHKDTGTHVRVSCWGFREEVTNITN